MCKQNVADKNKGETIQETLALWLSSGLQIRNSD